MKIKEFIEVLSKLDPSLEVVIDGIGQSGDPSYSVNVKTYKLAVRYQFPNDNIFYTERMPKSGYGIHGTIYPDLKDVVVLGTRE